MQCGWERPSVRLTAVVDGKARCPTRSSSPPRPSGPGHARPVLDAGVPTTWVTAVEVYGKDHKFRTWLETHASATSWQWPATRPFPPRLARHEPTSWPHRHLRKPGSAAVAARARRGLDCSTGRSPRYRCTRTPRRRAGHSGCWCADP